MPQSGELGGWWLHRAQRTGWVVTGPAQSQSSASCPRVHTTPAWDNSNSSDTTHHTNNTVIPPWPPSEPASSSSSPAWPPPRQSKTKVR